MFHELHPSLHVPPAIVARWPAAQARVAVGAAVAPQSVPRAPTELAWLSWVNAKGKHKPGVKPSQHA